MIKQTFDGQFLKWGITLPLEDIELHRNGSIHKNGWTINYRFVVENDIEYMEYFASHRMTNDTINRIFADGRIECIDFCLEFFPAGDESAENELLEHNRNFYASVRRKGLL